MKRSMHYSRGFSLVELMVALLIGLVIILGAGQLFLTGFQNFRKIEELSDKQAALTFAAEILIRDIRRAELSVTCNSVPAQLSVYVDEECRYYDLHDGGEAVSLRLNVDGNGWEPVADGFKNTDQFQSEDDGFFTITFRLDGEMEDVVFHTMNRTKAVNP
ncbi:prepilin-type N-terminal cleavage/methylation domain-containing protein [Halomonas campisalis]|uniref:Prepilin-type N-terminal cleavage/methylation domain-containing protein n=1 Tax=Billgrantia campisalis TaxID=74661 RepID=A0ABS9PEE6_9GAMM|nr:type II secretion system protein [Halomonas campisalis]MCG6659490.1 prepilin-type N-terminal cleavage/methylation domain-containing protein [Halomonas campisalis]MDR5864305.1 prepilin-type N-terminal cleavage/methylation domain-containing protein [Halomonas campisalis]